MIKDRVIQVLEYKKIAKESFYVKIGMTSASFRGKAKNTPLNSSAIENILTEIPDLNANWLLTGHGEMLSEEVGHMDKNTEKVNQRTENIFTGDTDKDIEDYISDAFAKHLLEMYETGRVYPAAVVKSMIEEKNIRIRELEKEVKELNRKIDQNNRNHNIGIKKDRQ